MKTSVWTGIWVLFCLLYASVIHGQMPAGNSTADTTVVTFRFVPEQDMFYIPWAGNGAQLERLYVLLDEYRSEITAGRMPVYVDGYCTSLPTYKENLQTAYLRTTRVKSELITRKGLKEADFITSNYAAPYHGKRDVVVVTLRIPSAGPSSDSVIQTIDSVAPRADTVILSNAKDLQPRNDTVILSNAKDLQPQNAKDEIDFVEPFGVHRPAQNDNLKIKPYTLALRTNLLYDALLLPTLGVEWRINRDFGVRLDGSLAHWGSATGKVQKVWLLNPEVRRYLLYDRRFYVGLAASYGEYNLYKYPLGSLFSGDTGYQGHLWGAALTVGYQLPLCRCLGVDFNLGLGYTCSEYDSFTLTDGARVIRQRGKSKNLFGPTQAGVHLVWTIGGNK